MLSVMGVCYICDISCLLLLQPELLLVKLSTGGAILETMTNRPSREKIIALVISPSRPNQSLIQQHHHHPSFNLLPTLSLWYVSPIPFMYHFNCLYTSPGLFLAFVCLNSGRIHMCACVCVYICLYCFVGIVEKFTKV